MDRPHSEPPLSALSPEQHRQIQLEEEARLSGIAVYRERLERLRANGHGTLLRPEQSLIHLATEVQADIIETIRLARSNPGRMAAAVPIVETADPGVLAVTALRSIINRLHKPRSLQSAAVSIGREIEAEMRLAYFEEINAPLFKKIERHISESPRRRDPQYPKRMRLHALKKYAIGDAWPHSQCLLVGAWLIDRVVRTTGVVEVVAKGDNRMKMSHRTLMLRATDELAKYLDSRHGHMEILSPPRMPLVCPPRPFEDLRGGYYTKALSKPLVPRRDKALTGEYTAEKMPVVFGSVNALISTPWEVDPRILDVATHMWEVLGTMPSVGSREDLPMPIEPEDATPSEWRDWKARRKETDDANVSMRGRRLGIAQTLAAARRSNEDPLWYSGFLDFRGRFYYDCSYLTPQGSDLSKGLLRFHRPMKQTGAGAYWLMVHAANCAGVDKVAFAERVAWVEERKRKIRETAKDPLRDLWWTELDSPFSFLAACFELAEWWEKGEEAETRICVWMDGSCNGVQHLSAMSLDAEGGALTNLTPGPKPADLYSRVAEGTREKLQTLVDSGKDREKQLARLWLDYGIDRAICKRPTMILPYGGTATAAEKYIDLTVLDRVRAGKPHPFGSEKKYACAFLSRAMLEAMNAVVKGPREVMKWTKGVAKATTKAGAPIRWRTPSGFVVQQMYRGYDTIRVKVRLTGREVRLQLRESTEQIASREQARSLAPNLIHSFDAANMHLTFYHGLSLPVPITDVGGNHDSYGCHAPNVPAMHALSRQQFYEMYKDGKSMDRFLEDVGSVAPGLVLPPPPATGTLDISQVLKSPYFFA